MINIVLSNNNKVEVIFICHEMINGFIIFILGRKEEDNVEKR